MLLADIGNSSIHLAIRRDESIAAQTIISAKDFSAAKLRCWFNAATKGFVLPRQCVISSVSKSNADKLIKALASCGLKRKVVLKYPKHPFIKHRLLTPKTTGIDRLCAARAAFELANGPAIIIDLGTAITIDAVDGDGAFLGGTILPGPSLWLTSLSLGTAQLPMAQKEFDKILPQAKKLGSIGRGTAEAISLGLAHGLIGGIERIVAMHKTVLGDDAQIYTTGGAAKLLRGQVSFSFIHAPDLVLDGVWLAAQTVLTKKSSKRT